MATASVSTLTSSAPVLLRPRNFLWYVSSTDERRSGDEETWQQFTDVENEIIEDAYKENKTEVEIDGGRIINLKHRFQHKNDDVNTQFPVKRVQLSKDRSYENLREDRFSFPATLASTTPAEKRSDNAEVNQVQESYDILEVYNEHIDRDDTTYSRIVEEAAQGIIKVGIALGKQCEARWLAQRLRNVKDHGTYNVMIERGRYGSFKNTKIPRKIGDTIVYLYRKESFWYKTINSALRQEPHTITHEQAETLGPFCYLLLQYLKQIKGYNTSGIIVYRGLTLTDEQRQKLMQEKQRIKFKTFISTSRNKVVAEMFAGNTLLIISIEEQYESEGDCMTSLCGTNVSHLSAIPDEEEFLIWPETLLCFDKYEYDIINSKHVIYLSVTDDIRWAERNGFLFQPKPPDFSEVCLF